MLDLKKFHSLVHGYSMGTCFLFPLVLAVAVLAVQPVVAQRPPQDVNELVRQGYYAAGPLGNLPEAEQIFRRALDLDPNKVEAYIGLGDVLSFQGNLVEATNNYRIAVRLAPDAAFTYTRLSYALYAQGNLEEAITNCRSAILLDPNYTNAYVGLGLALAAQGNLEEAITNYHTAIRLDPQYSDIQKYLREAEQRLAAQGQTKL